MQFVADIDNAAALAGQLAQHNKEFFHCLRCEHRGGFVKNEQTRVGQKRANDLHALHLAHRQGVHRAQRIDLQAVARGCLADAARDLGQTGLAIQAQPDVFRHGEAVKQAEVLKHHGNAQVACLLRVVDVYALTVDAYHASVRAHSAVDDFHQRGLASAVLAQQGVDFTGAHGQVDAVVGHHRGVALGNALQLQAQHRGTARRCGGRKRGLHGADCRSIHTLGRLIN